MGIPHWAAQHSATRLLFARELPDFAVLLPMALAVLLSFVLAPPVKLLQRLHLPRFAAVTIVVLLAFGVIFGLATQRWRAGF